MKGGKCGAGDGAKKRKFVAADDDEGCGTV